MTLVVVALVVVRSFVYLDANGEPIVQRSVSSPHHAILMPNAVFLD